ncbi:hypothetical protein Lal_00040885 [Lupinus albus]|nr:hypothetical protein Lal_00040885 [Lupinus albus]
MLEMGTWDALGNGELSTLYYMFRFFTTKLESLHTFAITISSRDLVLAICNLENIELNLHAFVWLGGKLALVQLVQLFQFVFFRFKLEIDSFMFFQ